MGFPTSRFVAVLLVGASTFVAAIPSTAEQPPPMSAPPGVRNFDNSSPKFQLVEATRLMYVEDARNLHSVDGSGLTVAVLDTGINTTHGDFAGRIVGGRNFTDDNGGDDANFEDGNGHGSNCAGVVMANGTHRGVAPGAKVYVYKILPNVGGGEWEWLRDALDDVIANHEARDISVVSISIGDSQNWQSESWTFAIFDEIRDQIQTLRNERVAVCIAAGNDYRTHGSVQGMCFPGICPASVSVGAVFDAIVGSVGPYNGGAEAHSTTPGQIAPWSQRYHQSTSPLYRTDMFAPGPHMTSSGIGSTTASSTMDGTSQATPCVAGLILLMQQLYKRQTGILPTVDELEEWLRESANPEFDGDNEDDNVTHTMQVYPLTFAPFALDKLQAALDANSLPSVRPIAFVHAECDGVNDMTLSTIVDDAESDHVTVNWYVEGDLTKSEFVQSGSTVEFRHSYDHFTYGVIAEVFDGVKTNSEGAIVKVTDTTVPIVTVSNDVTVSVDRGELVATNVDLGTLDVFDACDADPAITNDAPTEYPIGETTVTWTVTDDFGNVATAEQKVIVLNAAPNANAGRNVTATTTSATGDSVKLDGSKSSDGDEHDLTYRWEADGVTFDDETSARPTGQFPLGSTSVTLTVTDEAGEFAARTVVVGLSGLQNRTLGGYANYYSTYGYLYAYYSVAGGNYQSDNVTGYQYALYGYLYGYYADDVVEWDEETSKDDALADYLTLRYYQTLFDQYGSQSLYAGYAATGDVNSIYGYLFSYYGQVYGEADLAN